MIRTILAACLSLSALAGPVQAQERISGRLAQPVEDAGPLATPGQYGFGPDDARPGGVASLSVGSRNLRTAAIGMQSGLIGGTGLRAFVTLQAGRAPDLYGGGAVGRLGLVTQGAGLGVEKQFADGTIVSIEGGWQHDRWSTGRSGYTVPAGPP